MPVPNPPPRSTGMIVRVWMHQRLPCSCVCAGAVWVTGVTEVLLPPPQGTLSSAAYSIPEERA